ncbi:MAG TPA: SDR family oxidoreductase [Egibacteraceae bacterium]|nr:SDR family oxidoreductase [Egibacteraceae bacterium]
MELGLEGRVGLVTAASRGLGRACAVALGGEGMRVGIAARSEQALAEVAAEITSAGGEALPISLDFRQEDGAERAVAQVLDAWGRIDALVANAPGPPSGRVEDISVDAWRSALDVNVLGMVRLVQGAIPPMKRQGGGRIVFITTVGVRIAQPEMVLSNASRLAVVGLSKSLALELAEHNIIANVIAPGPIETDRMEELFEQTAERRGIDIDTAREIWVKEVPLGRMGRPEDVANLVALLCSDAASYTTGAVITVDGGKDVSY